MSWKLDTITAKYNTAKKDVLETTAKFDLGDPKRELKVGHKSKTDDVLISFKTKKPFEFEASYDVKPKTTTISAKFELFDDKVDLKVKQVVAGNKWAAVPSPRIDVEFEPSKKFETILHWDMSKRNGGAKVISKVHKKHEVTAIALVNDKCKATELKAEYEFMPKQKWCDEIEVSYSTVTGAQLQWEAKPAKDVKTDVKANLKTKKVSAQLEYKLQTKKPTVKTVLDLACPIDKPNNYTASATITAEYKF